MIPFVSTNESYLLYLEKALSQFRAVGKCGIFENDSEVFRSPEEEAGFRIQSIWEVVKWVECILIYSGRRFNFKSVS